MSYLVYVASFLLVFWVSKCQSILPAVVVLHSTPERRLKIRSTPSLDPSEEILEKFGNGNKLNASQVEELLRNVGLWGMNHTSTSSGQQACFSSRYFFGMYSRNDGDINRTDLINMCPAILYQLSKDECRQAESEKIDDEDTGQENPRKAWGFGFLFVTVISCCSLIGALVVPMMDRPIYKKVLMCMVSLAVGVLGGSGIFHLMPSALGFPSEDGGQKYLWKCAMIGIGIYVFFVLECSMKLYIRYKSKRKNRASYDLSDVQDEKSPKSNGVVRQNGHGHSHAPNGHSHSPPVIVSNNGSGAGSVEIETDLSTTNSMEVITKKQTKRTIATVAWMIIIGDGLHNFIDGLAIGASFSSSVVSGVSTSLAVISEEVPHELGDFAILLNSGFTYKEAMLANFLSACCCYLGLVIGLLLGYATSAVKYIYGIAGGMFLYISLVDMLPEAIEMAYIISGNSTWKSIKMLIMVNIAMVTGFAIMLVLAIFAPGIEI